MAERNIISRIASAIRNDQSETRANLEDPDQPVTQSQAMAVTGGHSHIPSINVNPDSARTYSAVYAADLVISQSLAATPIITYRRLEPRGKERATDHPIYRLLHDEPNAMHTAYMFKQTMQSWANRWGNAYAFIDRDQSETPTQLIPIHPAKIVVSRQNAQLFYHVHVNDEWRTVPSVDMLHISGLGDGIIGDSPIRLMARTIGIGMAAEQYSEQFFSQGLNASGYFSHPNQLSDKARANLKRDINERNTGLENAHKYMLLEEGVKFERTSIPAQEAQLIEARRFQPQDIARAFRVPLHKINDMSGSTHSNIEQEALNFLTDTLQPWFVNWEQELSRKLVTEDEKDRIFVEYLREAHLQADKQSQAEYWKALREMGAITPNEIREQNNMNPYEGGDSFISPMNMQTIGNDPTQSRSNESDKLNEIDARLSQLTEKLETRENQPAQHTATTDHTQSEDRSIRQRVILSQTHHDIILDAANRLIRKESNAMRKAAEKTLAAEDVDGFIQRVSEFYTSFESDVRTAMSPIVSAYARSIQAMAAQEIGEDAELTERMRDFIQQYLSGLAARHVGTSRQTLQNLARNADSPEAARELINSRLDEWENNRPTRIAEREIRQVKGAIVRETFTELGVERLRLVDFGDGSNQVSQALDGREVNIDEPFVQEGEQVAGVTFDRPLKHPPFSERDNLEIIAVQSSEDNEQNQGTE
jgi:HK97 family phage portal protein